MNIGNVDTIELKQKKEHEKYFSLLYICKEDKSGYNLLLEVAAVAVSGSGKVTFKLSKTSKLKD